MDPSRDQTRCLLSQVMWFLFTFISERQRGTETRRQIENRCWKNKTDFLPNLSFQSESESGICHREPEEIVLWNKFMLIVRSSFPAGPARSVAAQQPPPPGACSSTSPGSNGPLVRWLRASSARGLTLLWPQPIPPPPCCAVASSRSHVPVLGRFSSVLVRFLCWQLSKSPEKLPWTHRSGLSLCCVHGRCGDATLHWSYKLCLDWTSYKHILWRMIDRYIHFFELYL